MKYLAVAAFVIGLAAVLAGCSSGGGSESSRAAKDLVEALAGRNAPRVAELMNISETEAARLISASFASSSQGIRDVIVTPNVPGCEPLTEEQTASGVTSFCHLIADLQFKEDEEWKDLRLAFIVEVCEERAIVSLDRPDFVSKC